MPSSKWRRRQCRKAANEEGVLYHLHRVFFTLRSFVLRKINVRDVEQVKAVQRLTSSFLTLYNGREKAKSVQLPIVVLNLIGDVKIQDVIDDDDPATMFQLSDSTRTL